MHDCLSFMTNARKLRTAHVLLSQINEKNIDLAEQNNENRVLSGQIDEKNVDLAEQTHENRVLSGQILKKMINYGWRLVKQAQEAVMVPTSVWIGE